MGFQIVPEFGHENQFFRGCQSPDFWELFKNHKQKIMKLRDLATNDPSPEATVLDPKEEDVNRQGDRS